MANIFPNPDGRDKIDFSLGYYKTKQEALFVVNSKRKGLVFGKNQVQV